MSGLRDIAGQTFARLYVIQRAPNDGVRVMWWCKCACGKTFIARGTALTSGNTKSCGCLVAEKMASVGRSNGTHRQSRTPEYRSWARMLHRCYCPEDNRYQYYGALGVQVCARWRLSFEAFLADMGKKPSLKHSIDRYPDPFGPYEPSNCRWATPLQQRHNRRDSNRGH